MKARLPSRPGRPLPAALDVAAGHPQPAGAKKMSTPTDLEVAKSVPMAPIGEIAGRLGIDEADIEPYGRYKAKIALSVIDKESGRWAGRLGPWQPEGWPGTEVGWGIAREFWGKGYAPEGATAAIDWAFEHLGWTEVIHCIDPGNTNSQGVARKLGSSILRHALLPPPISESVDVWGQTREQWRARRA